MKHQWLKLLAVSSFGILCFYIVSCKEQKQNSTVKTVTISFKKEGELQLKKATSDSLIASLNIEIADDDYSTQTGLMYRKSMEDNQAMLFIFPDSDYRSFYMKNTKIPLDIIYISEDKRIVSIQKNAKPMDETSLPSEAPATYVLEVNAGLSDTWNLEKGDTIEFKSN
ncbi:DUF192 domain-containing protein [Psychroserpens ponticola]|uniref:DUF192 domain-containing protein n=1 Tax=Psychroserpens ponticola TaxID=2932268 RepID=A0ABY7RZ63_9FLAO|nr:DUF192 domain-containing protein [Psychroserpens ponticola]WCO02424.1 DUF192 domain-containing protein [Psychroserpens ponticola]